MSGDWDDSGEFETIANLDIEDADLDLRDPFDLSKALEGMPLKKFLKFI